MSFEGFIWSEFRVKVKLKGQFKQMPEAVFRRLEWSGVFSSVSASVPRVIHCMRCIQYNQCLL